MKRMIGALICTATITCFGMNGNKPSAKTDNITFLVMDENFLIEPIAKLVKTSDKQLEIGLVNATLLNRLTEVQKQRAQAAELNAASKAAKVCVRIESTGRYNNVITRSDCEDMIQRYTELAKKESMK